MESTTAASPPLPTTSNRNKNAKVLANSSKTREEGELSASENGEFTGSQFPDSTTLPGAPVNKDAYQRRKSSLTRILPSSLPSRSAGHSNNSKGTEKNRVPFVISFSDDDSGSDSEEHMTENTIESDDLTKRVMENRKLPISVENKNPQTVQKTAKTNTKIPKKLSVSRTFLSSMNRVNGPTSSKNNGNTFHIKKSSSPSKKKVGPNVHVNSSELQDLRQLIAIRENEMKSKASTSLNNSTPANMNPKSTTVRSRDPTEPVEQKEPEKKRLKVSEPLTQALIPVDQQDRPPKESTLVADISAPESDGPKDRYDGSYSDKDTGQPTATQQTKKVRHHSYNMPLTNLPSGTGIIRSSRRHNRITNMVESSAPLVAKTAKDSPHKQARMKNQNQNQNQNQNLAFWNHYGPTQTTMSDPADLDLKSLLEIEEQQDKELDEAQEHRRKCEIEERKALKAYRKAQRALIEANSKCSYLYHQRELFSANLLRSHVIDDSPMFWSNLPRQHHSPKLLSESYAQPHSSSSQEEDQAEEEKSNNGSSSLHENNHNDNSLGEDEQTSAFEMKANDSSLDSQGEGSERTRNENSVPVDPTEDSLLLEATLRSQLFARLGNRIPKRVESVQLPSVGEREDGEITEASGDFHDSFPEPILRTAFSHVNFKPPTSTDEMEVSADVATEIVPNQKLDFYAGGEIGSYSNNLPIDPSWPLCMFELRGKCNNDECPWQHLKDSSVSSTDNVLKNGNGCVPLAPPTYLVCLDSLKSDSHPYKYLVAQTVEQRWHKYFTASLVVSTSVLADLNSDESYLHGPETRIEVHGGWNRQLSYFHGQHVKEDQHIDDTHHSLEIALLKLTRDVNKLKGRREALIVLARALEEHPTSVLVWIVYLHIYYINQKSIGKDDLFHYAIEHNDSSYELWLMFINSREKLDDRILAYTTAMSALCRHTSDSAYILDIFLQMINCLVSCEKVNDAIQKVKPSNLASIDTHLTTSDKSILYICSIYLVMYKKLPDTIIQQFECPKDLPAIQWDSVELTLDEKQQVVMLMEVAHDSLKESHLFAVNHVKCTAVVHGFDSSKNLLNKYLHLHPSSIDLVLLSIRVNELDPVNSPYSAFEEALTNWAGKPGVECIWNQYAEFALHNEKPDLAKQVMEKWVLSNSTKTDERNVFGLVNLSLHKHLQNKHEESRIAIEQALETASSKNFTHIASEHALFFLKTGHGSGLLTRLTRYVTDPRATCHQQPLSRTFINTIENPKLQKLVSNLLSPVSSDFSVMNSVMGTCFGPGLLPGEVTPEFAENVMELRPGNYVLALCLCKKKMESSVGGSSGYWAGLLLMNSLFQAVPVGPEWVWVEAGGLLGKMLEFKSVLESFYKRGLSVYPFSVKLWKLYVGLYGEGSEEGNRVIEMAREKGLKL